jgi:PUA domain protein
MDIVKRHALRKSDLRKIKESLHTILGDQVDNLFGKNVEYIETDKYELYAENKVVLAFKIKEVVLPSLRALNNNLVKLPTVTVDMGAVPYVTNGADIMAPGITELTPGLAAGTFITIIDERHGKSLAVGMLLKNSDEILATKKGKVIKNLHYVNDDIWNLEL